MHQIKSKGLDEMITGDDWRRSAKQVYENADFYYEQSFKRTESKIIERAESVYFLGIGTSSFWQRSAFLASKLSNFSGLIGGERAKNLHKNRRFDRLGSNFKVKTLEEIDRSKKIVLVDFGEGFYDRIFSENLKSKFEVVNWLQATHDLGGVHTYLPLKEEREEIYKNIDLFKQIDAMLADDLSRITLSARLQSLLSLDPFFLQKIQSSPGIVGPKFSTDHPIYANENEDFVDVGAHDGDTVKEFVNSTEASYASITAYEPDKRSFNSLAYVLSALPAAKAYNFAVSDFNGEVNFYQDADNSLGSHIKEKITHPEQTETCTCVKLDEHISKMSFLAIDVEGYELNVLKGSAGLIKSFQPRMHISAYHYPLDIPKIIFWLNTISNRKLFIRHQGATLYDTNILVG